MQSFSFLSIDVVSNVSIFFIPVHGAWISPSSNIPDMSSVALPQESHLFRCDGDKNYFLSSSSVSGNPYSPIAGSQCLSTSTKYVFGFLMKNVLEL